MTHQDDHDDDEHNDGRLGTRDVQHDSDPRLTRGVLAGIYEVFRVGTDIEHEGDGSSETQDVVDDGGREHGTRKDVARIAEFFGQVHGGVGTQVGGGRADLSSNVSANVRMRHRQLYFIVTTYNTDECGQSNAAPVVAILEGGEDLLGWRAGTHDPQNDEESEEAEDVQDDGQTFQNGQFADSKCVEGDGAGDHGHGQESAVPTLGDITRVADGDQGHDLLSTNVCDRRHGSLPSERTEPADWVTITSAEFVVLRFQKCGWNTVRRLYIPA
jgi:hypothetical protein